MKLVSCSESNEDIVRWVPSANIYADMGAINLNKPSKNMLSLIETIERGTFPIIFCKPDGSVVKECLPYMEAYWRCHISIIPVADQEEVIENNANTDLVPPPESDGDVF